MFAADPTMSPVWWSIAALVGLALGRLPARLRLALAALIFGLATSYLVSSSEANPLWGQWRYFVPLLPLCAVAAAALVARLPRVPGRELLVGALSVATVASILGYRSLLARPINFQLEHDYLRESAPRIARDHPDLAIIADPDLRGRPIDANDSRAPFDHTTLMALATSIPVEGRAIGCGATVPDRRPRIWASAALSSGCQPAVAVENVALYLGLFRPKMVLDEITQRFRLEPIEERRIAAAPAVPFVDTRCTQPHFEFVGRSLPDCEIQLGWYRLVPIAPTAVH
jgi:hypothetical protein